MASPRRGVGDWMNVGVKELKRCDVCRFFVVASIYRYRG